LIIPLLLGLAAEENPIPKIVFVSQVIHAESDFEAAGVADIDGDGDLDVICGDSWYRAPEFARQPIGEIVKEGGYRHDFANAPFDVDRDGDPDVVSCNWHKRSVLWRENPRGVESPPPAWHDHAVDEPGNMETAIEVDVDGDGVIDFLPDVAQNVVWC
jgi:FG-GAP-like repeat